MHQTCTRSVDNTVLLEQEDSECQPITMTKIVDWKLFTISIMFLVVIMRISYAGPGSRTKSDTNRLIIKTIAEMTKSSVKVYQPGTKGYNAKRKVHNGLCVHMKPSLIAVPKTTKDVSALVRVANLFKMDISVRSGGHSYVCTSIRNGKTIAVFIVCFQIHFFGFESQIHESTSQRFESHESNGKLKAIGGS